MELVKGAIFDPEGENTLEPTWIKKIFAWNFKLSFILDNMGNVEIGLLAIASSRITICLNKYFKPWKLEIIKKNLKNRYREG